MKNRAEILAEIRLASVDSTVEEMLFKHYQIMYPHKIDFLKKNYKWLNSPKLFDYQYPRIAIYQELVAGHINFTPFHCIIDKNKYSGSWGGDLSVLKPYRGSGLGVQLIKEYLKLTDIYFAFGNNNSMNLVKKRLNWEECFETYMHYFPLDPLKNKKIPTIAKKMFSGVLKQGLKFFYKKNATPIKYLSIEKANPENIKGLITRKESLSDNVIYAEYSYEQLYWRIIESPYANDYRIVHFADMKFDVLIKVYSIDGQQHLDLMRTPESITNHQINRVLASLAVWSIANDISLIRYYTSSKLLSTALSKNLKGSVKHPRCCYWSADDNLFETMKQSNWRWEIIDSDFEKF